MHQACPHCKAPVNDPLPRFQLGTGQDEPPTLVRCTACGKPSRQVEIPSRRLWVAGFLGGWIAAMLLLPQVLPIPRNTAVIIGIVAGLAFMFAAFRASDRGFRLEPLDEMPAGQTDQPASRR